MIRACILAILLIAASADATGLWLDGREQIASSSSVVTNSTTNATQHITNSAFAEGIGGWSMGLINGGQTNLWYSNGNIRAMRMAGDLSWQTDIRYVSCVPVVTQTGAVFSIKYWYTNTETVFIYAYNSATGSEFVAGQELVNEGMNVTSVYSRDMADATNFSGLVIRMSTPGDETNAAIFFESITITSVVASTSITTNSGSGASGPTLDGIVPLSTNRHTYLNGVRQ